MASDIPESSMKHWILVWGFPLLIVLIGVGAVVAMGKSKPKQVASDDSDPAVKLSKLPIVFAKPILPFDGIEKLDIDLTGVVVPYRQVTLAAEVGGRVEYKSDACRIGRFVQEGEPLIKLDATDYKLEVERLAALRDSEYAQQKELDQELANSQRSLELADQEVELQEKELRRLEQLPSGFASATELDQARRMLLTSSTQRLMVQNQLEMSQTRRTRIELAERLASTQLALAKVNLARTEINAPISGVIVAEMVEQASYVQKGATLCMIHDTQRAEVSCNLRADQLMLVLDQKPNGQSSSDSSSTSDPIDLHEPTDSTLSSSQSYELPPTPVTIEYRVLGRSDSVYQWQGFLSRYEGIGINPQSRTIPIRITVENPRQVTHNGQPIGPSGGAPLALVQGMFIDCHIHTTPNRPLILIPKLALRPGNQVWKYVVDSSNSTSDAWSVGNIQIVNRVRIVRSIHWPSETTDSKNQADEKGTGAVTSTGVSEYWVAEAHPELEAGSMMVVSPLSNMIGDGTDKARLAIPNAAPTEETSKEPNESKGEPKSK